MANKKISTMTPATTVDGTESLEVVQSGVNKKMTVSLLKSFEESFTALSGTTWDVTIRKRKKDISADTNITFSNLIAGKSTGLLRVTQTGGPHTLTLGGSEVALSDDGPTLVWFVDTGDGIILVGSSAGGADPITPPSWVDLAFATNVGLVESPSKVFSGPNGGFGNYGISATVLAGTGAFRCKTGTPGSNANALFGLKTSNSNGDYTTFKYGAYMSEESGHLRINYVVDGTPTAVAGAVLGVGYVNYGYYIVLFRDVATGVVTLQTSPDGTTWTVSWTFAATSAADLYPLINPPNGSSVYLPQLKLGAL